MMDLPILSMLIFLPVVVAFILMWIPSDARGVHRNVALGTTLIELILLIPLWQGYDPNGEIFQMGESSETTLFGIQYLLGIDGPALLLIALTIVLMPLVILSTYSAVQDRVREFVIALLLLQAAMIGAFCALDMFVFYIFWEFMLIPMALLIGVWGGERRIYAAMKFFLYTLAGSLLMLVAILYLHHKAGSDGFAITEIAGTLQSKLSEQEQLWLFGAFALSFAIKVPLFPVHTWLPDAHTEAPAAGSVVLAAVMLKMGIYGFYRFAIPLFPEAMGTLSPLLISLAVVAIIYGALVAYAQTDMKRLVAYSSVSHMGFVMLGLITMNPEGVNGSMVQMISHGICTGALFLLVGMIYERRHTRRISDYGGLAKTMPVFTTFFIIVTFSSIGLPGTSGFIGEFLILDGAMQDALYSGSTGGGDWAYFSYTSVILAASGVILGAVYMLTLVRRIFFGPIVHEENKTVKDLGFREWCVMAPLVFLIFLIGLRPGTLTEKMEPSVNSYLLRYGPAVCRARDPESGCAERFEPLVGHALQSEQQLGPRAAKDMGGKGYAR